MLKINFSQLFKKISFCAVISLTLLSGGRSWGYNFLYLHPDTKQPISWEPGTTIEYWVDNDDLHPFTRDQAATLIQEAAKIWGNAAPYANVPKFKFMGFLPENVTVDNYTKYTAKLPCYTDELENCETEGQKNLQTYIIFDAGGSIVDKFCIYGDCTAVAGGYVFNGSPENPNKIVAASIIFDQLIATSDIGSTAAALGTIVHEFGHLLGLAHPSLNQFASITNDALQARLITTMWSGDEDPSKATLNPDDIAGIATLYPGDTYHENTGIIKGKTLLADLSPMHHINVVARDISDPFCKAYSYISGRTCEFLLEACNTQPEYSDPTFTLSGLPPATYTVEVEEIIQDSQRRVISPGLNPDDNIYGDAELWNINDTANEDNMLSTTIELKAGETLENIDIVLSDIQALDNRIKLIPMDTFIAGSQDFCLETPTTDYAALIGRVEKNISDNNPPPSTGSTGGCSLVRE